MTRVIWDAVGERFYETGVKNAVLYVRDNTGAYPAGVPWNGITAITESPSGAEANPLYADDIKYVNLLSAEEFGATVEAYTYPEEFAECDGSKQASPGVFVGQQERKPFGLVYKTTLGNDTERNDHGYKLHLIYNALAAPSERAYNTINDSPDAITFSWELASTPEAATGMKPVSSITIDSTKADAAKLALLEDALFGDASTGVAHLPLPDAVIAMLA